MIVPTTAWLITMGRPADLKIPLLTTREQPRQSFNQAVGILVHYWRPITARISLSVSVMRSPPTSTVTVWSFPVNRNGAL